MRNEQRAFEELSAYLDGEARRPERVAERLAHDPAYAREAAALRRLSEQVRALPAPAPRPDFVARVLSGAQATLARPARIMVFWKPALALAATVIIVLGAVLYARVPDTAAPVEQPAAAAPVVLARWENDEEIVDALAQLAEAGADLSFFEPVPFAPEPPDESLAATILESVVAAAWDIDAVSPYADARDTEALIESLDATDTNTLRELMGNSANGGRRS